MEGPSSFSTLVTCLILVSLSTMGSVVVDAQSSVTVTTPVGDVLGSRTSRTSIGGRTATIDKFLGIPFAKAPVGELRFRRPQAHGGWTGTLDGTKEPAACVQTSFGGAPPGGAPGGPGVNGPAPPPVALPSATVSNKPQPPPMMAGGFGPSVLGNTSEDCLFLNVISPRAVDEPTNQPLPVLIYIHGGGLRLGSALESNRVNFAVETDAIVVSIAYRLGVYGFFAIDGSRNYPGNLALWDQVMAFKWVKDNIAAFGGDPNKVTISGFSAGGRCVSMHLTSPASRGLFSAGISWSGTQLDFKAFPTKPSSAFLLTQLNCTADNSKCIGDASQADIDNFVARDGLFMPVYDGEFFPADPWILLREGRYNKVPYMLGINSDEGLSQVIMSMRGPGDINAKNLQEQAFKLVNQNMINLYDLTNIQPSAKQKLAREAQRRRLSEDTQVGTALRQAIDTTGDVGFVYPIKKTADTVAANQANVYFYYYDHTAAMIKDLYERNLLIEIGAGHAESLHILFAETDKPMSEYERKLSLEYLYSIGKFIHEKKPSLPGAGSEVVEWPTYTVEDGNYVEFGVENHNTTYRIRAGFPITRLAFWEDEVPRLLQELQITDQSDNQGIPGVTLDLFWSQLLVLVLAGVSGLLVIVTSILCCCLRRG